MSDRYDSILEDNDNAEGLWEPCRMSEAAFERQAHPCVFSVLALLGHTSITYRLLHTVRLRRQRRKQPPTLSWC